MRLLRYLIFAIAGYIIWKLVKFFMTPGKKGGRHPDPPTDFPRDNSFKNIEDADFEDVTGKSDKPS